MKGPCSVEGCENEAYCRGVCRRHYPKLRQTEGTRQPRLCSFQGCGRKYFARGWCKSHYDQVKKGRELAPLRGRKAAARDAICEIPGCTAQVDTWTNLCTRHFEIVRELGGTS